MNRVRGVVMLVAAGIVFFRGWQIHSGRYALLACALGVLALAMGIWHLTRKPPIR